MESNDNECDNQTSDIESVVVVAAEELSYVRRDRSPPIPVPINPNVVVLRGRNNPNTLSSSGYDFSEFGLSHEVRPSSSSSESEWRLSTDSGTQFDGGDDGDDDSSRRRISTGAESGYYGSPFNNNNSSRISSTPMTDVGSTMFAFDEFYSSVCRDSLPSSTGVSMNSNNVVPPFVFPVFPSNMSDASQPSTSVGTECSGGDDDAEKSGTVTATFPHPPPPPPPAMTLAMPNMANANAAHEERPPRPPYYERCENTFRSIGTQTSEGDYAQGHRNDVVNVHDDNDDEDANIEGDDDDDDEGLYETYDADDAFLPNVDTTDNDEDNRRPTLPDVIPISCGQGNERHRAHSVSLPLTPAVRAGRFLALIATEFDNEHRPNAHTRQNAPSTHSASYPGDNNNGGFLNFLRASLKSRRRPRAQSASAALP